MKTPVEDRGGSTLVESAIVIAIILVLAAAIYLWVRNAVDQARATSMKSRGRGVWLSIVSANMEREPAGQGPVWPQELRLPVEQGGECRSFTTATEYFRVLMAGDSPVKQLVSDLKPEMLSDGWHYPSTPLAANLTAENIAWRMADMSDDFPSSVAFLISKDMSPVLRSGASNEWVTLNRLGPLRGRRIVWLTRGGGLFDARKKYVPTWGVLFPRTNSVPFLPD